MNHFILEANRLLINLDKNEIIDEETLPFIPSSGKNKNINEKINIFASKDRCANPFIKRIDKNAYTRIIKVSMNNTEISNIKSFTNKFKSEFSSIIGNNILKDIIITKYKVNQKTINSIDVNAVFHIPLNLQYINNFNFPSNWHFLELD